MAITVLYIFTGDIQPEIPIHLLASEFSNSKFPPDFIAHSFSARVVALALARLEDERIGNTGSPVSGVSCTNWKSARSSLGWQGGG